MPSHTQPAIAFAGQVVVVTGGGSGIGRATALALATRGARVVVSDIGSAAGGNDTAGAVVAQIAAIGGEAIACTGSVATEEGGALPIETALRCWGRIDAVVAAAGNMAPATFADTPLESFRALFDVHLGGVVSTFQPAFRHMRDAGGGRLIIVSSAAGLFGGVGHANYGAAKGAQIGLMRTIAHEGAPFGIYCNTVMP